MKKWLLQTLSEVLEQSEPTIACSNVKQKGSPQSSSDEVDAAQQKAEGEWSGAIAALETILLQCFASSQLKPKEPQGIILSGPAPVLTQEAIISQIYRGIFTPEAVKSLNLMPFRLPGSGKKNEEKAIHSVAEFPLLSIDPLASEQFCLVCSANFALVMVLGEDSFGTTRFQFSFEPEVVRKAWQILRARLLFANFQKLTYLDSLFEHFSPIPPDYRTVMQFSREILKNLPDIVSGETERQKERTIQTNQQAKTSELINLRKYKTEVQDKRGNITPELELLQALTHEIRTPLTTIRTMTKLLLKKRKQFSADVIKRLEVIDQECTEQIDRMELIFRAAEMETTSVNSQEVRLTTIYLDQVFQQSIPRWQKQAQRRKVNLEFILPEKLPKVVSDPGMLDRVLTGLMENFTRSLPTGGEIQVQVTTAGNQLKLQFLSQCHYQTDSLKSLGQLLMFQPETGSLSLNLNVTKNLFHALGGKLIVRQRPQQGEVFTVFLPLSSPPGEGDWGNDWQNIQYQV